NGGYTVNYHGNDDTIWRLNSGPVEHLDTNQYSYNPVTGILTLTQEPADNDFIAVSYKTSTTAQYGDRDAQFGERAQDKKDTDIVLKLIKPRALYNNPYYPEWKNMLKNSYYVGASNIDPNNFAVKIAYTL